MSIKTETKVTEKFLLARVYDNDPQDQINCFLYDQKHEDKTYPIFGSRGKAKQFDTYGEVVEKIKEMFPGIYMVEKVFNVEHIVS